ncbi:hypothetical protein F383_33464 [Gossypium arboreum]|uniref:Uncharacterized protein n=1 Tax=Gossypium arboreum TaxID=29729 RepID=A0A0B0N5K8_GOSAR|nr:hypothetical protein F383_33464 [Gossypium arboreum]
MKKGNYMYFSEQLLICDKSIRKYVIFAKIFGLREMYMNIEA